jgi:hypothetical protein
MKAFRKPDNLHTPDFAETVLNMGSTKVTFPEIWFDQLEHHEQYL